MFARGAIVEDLPDARTWLQEVLTESFPGIAVETAATVAAGRQMLRVHRPQITLIDLQLPDGSGVDLIPLAISVQPGAQAVITTIYDDDAHVFPALRAGAQGYLLKDESRDDLVRQLRSITRGELPLSPSVAQAVLAHFRGRAAAPPPPQQPEEPLTDKEREVLTVVAAGFTITECAARLRISPNTVATHVKHIYAKLSVSSRAEAARMAAQLGLVDAPTR